MVEKEPFFGFVGIRRQIPGAGPLADRVPGPDGLGIDPLHQADLNPDLAMPAFDPDPVILTDAEIAGRGAVHVEPVVAVDLAQPGVLRAPGVVHGHGALGDGVKRKGRLVVALVLEGRIPEGQRVEIGLHPRPLRLGWLDRAMAASGQAKALQDLAVDLEDDRLGPLDEATLGGVVEIGLVGVLEVTRRRWDLLVPEAVVGDVALELAGVGRALADGASVLAAPAHQTADARFALVVDDVIGIAARIGG